MAKIELVKNTQFYLAAACGKKLYKSTIMAQVNDLYEPNDFRWGVQIAVGDCWITTEHLNLNYFDNTNATVFTVGISHNNFDPEKNDSFSKAEPFISDLNIIAFNTSDDDLDIARMAMQLIELLTGNVPYYIASNGLIYPRYTPSEEKKMTIGDLKRLEDRLIKDWAYSWAN